MHRSIVEAVVAGNAEAAAEAIKNIPSTSAKILSKWRGLTEKKAPFLGLKPSPPFHSYVLLDALLSFLKK
jgi:hypothetical protein